VRSQRLGTGDCEAEGGCRIDLHHGGTATQSLTFCHFIHLFCWFFGFYFGNIRV
jgi:hypothetical protein